MEGAPPANPPSVGLDELFGSLVPSKAHPRLTNDDALAPLPPTPPREQQEDVRAFFEQSRQAPPALVLSEPRPQHPQVASLDLESTAAAAALAPVPALPVASSQPRAAAPSSSSSSGGIDMAALLATLNLQFSKLHDKLNMQFASLNAKVDDLDHRLSRLQQSTPPPPSYNSVAQQQPAAAPNAQSMLPMPPPSFFQQGPVLPQQPPQSRRGPTGTRANAQVPTTSNTAVCSKCYLYFAATDLRAHAASCTGPAAAAPSRASPQPAASAPPASMAAPGEGRVVVHRGQYYWIPASPPPAPNQ